MIKCRYILYLCNLNCSKPASRLIRSTLCFVPMVLCLLFLCINRLEDFLKKNKGYESHFKDNKQDRKDYPEIKDNLWNEVNVDICSYAKCKNCNN